jgi:nucleotide-binding universal stress UspA family protein
MGRKPLGPWVVAGVDGSAGGFAAVEMAAAEATMRGLRLRVVASSLPDSERAGPLAARVKANRAVAEAASRACLTSPELTVRTVVLPGDGAETLIRESRTAGLLAVACHNRGDGSHPGSVCARVAAHAYCPVVVVPSDVDGTAEMFDAPVLVGVATAGQDEPAIGFAFEEAAARGVPLRAAHVWSAGPAVSLGDGQRSAPGLRSAWAATDRWLAETLAGWADKYPQVPVEPLPLYDVNPARALLLASAGAGLVVLGESCPTRYDGELFGMTTRVLIGHAGCPVCVVRPGGPATGTPRRGRPRTPGSRAVRMINQ